MKARELTQQLLKENGIELIPNNYEPGGWIVYQNGIRRKVCLNTLPRPYGTDKQYYKVHISINGVHGGLSLHALVWVYHYGSYAKGYDVSHINDDSYDNRLENLECITHLENIRKKKIKGNKYKNSKTITV